MQKPVAVIISIIIPSVANATESWIGKWAIQPEYCDGASTDYGFLDISSREFKSMLYSCEIYRSKKTKERTSLQLKCNGEEGEIFNHKADIKIVDNNNIIVTEPYSDGDRTEKFRRCGSQIMEEAADIPEGKICDCKALRKTEAYWYYPNPDKLAIMKGFSKNKGQIIGCMGLIEEKEGYFWQQIKGYAYKVSDFSKPFNCVPGNKYRSKK